MQKAMQDIGYVVSPNNIHSLPGVLMYAGGAGIPEPKTLQEVQVLPDRIRVFETKFFGEPYTRATYHDTITVAMFTNTADFVAWCREHGQISQLGMQQPWWID